MEVKDIVMKLIGNIEPYGETTADNKSFENLQEFTKLVDTLIGTIHGIAYHEKDRYEYSRKRSGEHCDKFLNDLKYELLERSDNDTSYN